MLENFFYWFFLSVDSIVYNFINWVYDIFNALAKINLFSNEKYADIVNNIYVILGIVMLFVLAYALLKAVVNPDDFAKGEKSFPKLIQNVVVSILIIVMLPSVFTVAFNIQNAFLNQDTIPQIIMGKSYAVDKTVIRDAGKKMSYYVFSAFFHLDVDNTKFSDCDKNGLDVNLSACANQIEGDENGLTLQEATDNYLNNDGDFHDFVDFNEEVSEGNIEYFVLISTIAGGYLLWVLVNFCFDLATRVVKLMFFQIIAPIPVICRILPGGSMKDVFPTWVKKIVSTFLEAFIRIAILYLGVYIVTIVYDSFHTLDLGGLGPVQKMITQALIIMGVVVFMKQAPKLIGDMFHLDSGSMKLGIMDKLAMGGALAAGAAIGGTVTGFGRNTVNAVQNMKKAQGIDKFKAALRIPGSALAGGASAGLRAGRASKGAKNLKDVGSSISKGAAKSDANRARRAARRAAHPDDLFSSYVADAFNTVTDYFGGSQEYKNTVDLWQKYEKNKKAIESAAGSLRDKNRNEASLVKSDMKADKWYGSQAQQALQQKYYQQFGMDRGAMSLAQLDNYIQQLSDEVVSVNDADFYSEKLNIATGTMEKVFDKEGRDAALREARIARSSEIQALNMMKNKLDKEANNIIINHSLTGESLGSIKADKFQQVSSSVGNAITQYEMDGSSVTDNVYGGEYGSINRNGNVASQLFDVFDAYEHNAVRAQSEAAKYEQKKNNNN